jgi:hypothetical protein
MEIVMVPPLKRREIVMFLSLQGGRTSLTPPLSRGRSGGGWGTDKGRRVDFFEAEIGQ